MKSSQLIPCGHLEILSESLKKVQSSSNVCLLACLTNFLTSIKDSADSMVAHRVEPVLSSFRQTILDACLEKPEISFIVSPPMYRHHPTWYRDSLPEIMTLFSQSLCHERPANLLLMSSFPTPSFEPDGVHLTAYSGLEYMLHLFDEAQELLTNLTLSTPELAAKSVESTRVLEDRVMALEQDHRRLVKDHELKVAIDAELHDWRMNERLEDFFVIKGLPALLSTGLSTKDWQVRAIRDVQKVMTIVMGKEMPIVYVQNGTVKGRDAVTTYHVQVKDAGISGDIRTTFSTTFFKNGRDTRPESLKPISIRNRVTQETHVRISILHLFGQHYTTSNPGSKYKVIGHQPRPQLKLFPASDASDRRVRSYNFIEAVKSLPKNFTAQESEDLVQRVPAKFIGKLRSLFVVLSDDLARSRPKPPSNVPAGAAGQPNEDADESVGSDQGNGAPVAVAESSQTNSRKRPPSPSAAGHRKSKKNNTK